MAEEDQTMLSVATWRVLTLFLFIIAIDLVCEVGNEAITHHFRHKQQNGLLHAWEQLKFETMALGLVSLLLIIAEEQLLKICIGSSGDSKDDKTASRRLLAKAIEHSCPDGQEPIWESKLIHKAHLLIFLIAAVHILYSMTSIGLSHLEMRRWKRLERQVADAQDVLPEPWAVQHGYRESGMLLGFTQLFRQIYRPIDLGTYAALRHLFLDRMNVAPDFNFAAFVSDYLAEEFSSVVKFDIFMWLLAIVWVAFPRGWYAGFAVTAFFVILSVASGAKLHAVAINLALQAPAATKNVAQSPPPVHSAGTGHGGRAARPALIPQGTTLGRQSRPQQRVSVPAAIAESAGAVSAFSERPCPTSAWDECPATRPGPTQRQPGVPTSSGPPGSGAADASAAVTVPCRADGQRPLDAQSFFWFGRPRLMLRVFRYAYFENALALAILVFGFWKQEGSVIGRESRYGRGPFAIGWILVDCVLLLLLHSSMFLLPLYALTAAAAEFSSPEHVLQFARERGIREDLVSFLEATESQVTEADKGALDAAEDASASLPVRAQHSAQRSADDAAVLISATAPYSRTQHTSPLRPSAASEAPAAAPAPTAPHLRSPDGSPAALYQPSSPSASPSSPVSWQVQHSHSPPAADASEAAAATTPAASGGVVGGPYAAAPAAPPPLPAGARSTLLHRVSAAGTLQRRSAQVPADAGIPSLQRPSVPCLPYSSAAPAVGVVGAGVAPGELGFVSRGYSQDLQRESAGAGLARTSLHRQLSMMADVVLGTDFLERSAQSSAPHGGNVARAADNPAATAAHTSPPAPFLVSASRHAHSVQGLLEAMALQRMVELSQQAPATTAGERHGP